MAEFDATYSIISHKSNAEKTVLIYNYPPLLVPKEFYQAEQQKEYLKFQYEIADIGKIFETEIEDYVALYFLNQHDYFYLTQQHPQLYFFHRTLYYHRLLKQQATSTPTAENLLVLLLDEKKIDFWLEKQSKLLLMNSFTFTSDYDILYLVTNILKQYDLLSDSCSMIIRDMTSKNGNAIKLLDQYYHVITFPEQELIF